MAPGTTRLLRDPWDLGHFVRPRHGENQAHQFVLTSALHGGIFIALADLTACGMHAAYMTRHVEMILRNIMQANLRQVLLKLHHEIDRTTGAMVNLMFLDPVQAQARFIGIGTSTARRCRGHAWHGVTPKSGLGRLLPGVQEQQITLLPGDVIAMWSDGLPEVPTHRFIRSHAHKSASAIAADLILRHAQPHRDATCVVLKWQAEQGMA